MTKITADFSATKGSIKPMHGVGQPPFLGTFGGFDFSMFRYLSEAGIPFSRLHDVGGHFGGGCFVDIPNLFRDFDADPEDPAAYDFTFTDMLLEALVQSGAEPFFRLGVTIENQACIKSYRIDPPKDTLKWAKICEGIIRHYTQGWANGYHYNIRYWEIWNEPDNYENINTNQMWHGTKEQYFALYAVASRYLKEKFPHLKIGGYASCGFYALTRKEGPDAETFRYYFDFFNSFLAYVKENGCPLDFFSWHSYGSIEETKFFAEYVRKRLDEEGFSHTEHTCNEWNFEADKRGTAYHAALTAGMLLAMQDSSLDSAMFYDARLGVSIYGGLFHPLTREPFAAYYAFMAFNELYKRQNAVTVSCDTPGLYAVGAQKDGDCCLVLANTTPNAVPLSLTLSGCRQKIKSCRLTDETHIWQTCALPETLNGYSFLCIILE